MSYYYLCHHPAHLKPGCPFSCSWPTLFFHHLCSSPKLPSGMRYHTSFFALGYLDSFVRFHISLSIILKAHILSEISGCLGAVCLLSGRLHLYDGMLCQVVSHSTFQQVIIGN